MSTHQGGGGGPPSGQYRSGTFEAEFVGGLQSLNERLGRMEAEVREIKGQVNGPPLEASLSWLTTATSKEAREVVKALEMERQHRTKAEANAEGDRKVLAAQVGAVDLRLTALETGAEGSATHKLKERIDKVDGKSKIDLVQVLVAALSGGGLVALLIWAVAQLNGG